MDDIIKIFESLEESGLLIKVVGKTIKIEAKKKGFVSQHVIMYIRFQFIRKYINSKEAKAKIYVRRLLRVGQGKVRAGQDF